MTDRIKNFISHLGLSDRAFAISCGITQNTLSRQLAGTRELSLSTVNAIINTYPELSLEWLFRGNGDMIVVSRKEPEAMDNDRVSKLIDTIAFQQCTINDQRAYISKIEEEKKRLSSELVMLKNDRQIG